MIEPRSSGVATGTRQPQESVLRTDCSMRERSVRLALLLALLMLPASGLFTRPVEAVEAVASMEAFGVSIEGEHDSHLRLQAGSGGYHAIWIRNGTRLMHAMWGGDGEALIGAGSIATANDTVTSHAIDVDTDDRLHIVWTEVNATGDDQRLRYMMIDVGNSSLDGSGLDASAIGIGPQTIVNRSGGRVEEVDLATDSQGAAHLVWIDEHDPLNRFHGTGQIRYTMLVAEQNLGYADAPIHDTLLTTTYGDRSTPVIAVDADDRAIVVWDDVRGGLIELVFVIPTDGSNTRIWRDICTILYGGANSGTNVESLKDLARMNGVDVLETMYGLHDLVPSTLGNGDDCSGKKTGQRSKTSHLTPSDHSGGLRKLHDTIFAGQPPVNWRNEIRDWGPGVTWACLSWRDSNGHEGTAANPPTTYDHQWNPDAEHIVIPVGRYGPFAGGSSMDSNDDQTVREAHDACVEGDLEIEVIRHDSNSGGVIDAMVDLVHCPENGIDTQRDSRDCDGTTAIETDLRGDLIDWRATTGDLNPNWRHLSSLVNGGQRSLWMTALDPYGKVDNDHDWVSGSSAHHETQGRYQEDIGRGRDGHLIVVNDTLLERTPRNGSDSNPAIDFDQDGMLHVTWMSTRNASVRDRMETEIEYQRFDLPDLGRTDGEATGLSSADFGSRSTFSALVSEVENEADRGFRDSHPDIVIDGDGSIHIVFTEQNSTDTDRLVHADVSFHGANGDQPMITRSPMSRYEADRFDTTDLPRSDPRSSSTGRGVDLAIGEDGILAGYDDRTGCTNSTQASLSSICIARMVPALHRFELAVNETLPLELQPGGSATVSILLSSIPGSTAPMDVEISTSTLSGVCDDWSITMVDSDDGSTIADGTRITGAASDSVEIDLSITAPSQSQVTESHQCTFVLSGFDSRYGLAGSFASIAIPAVVAVEHNLAVTTIQDSIEIEQGLEGAFTIEIENGGNIWINAQVADSTTPQGVTIWGLPFGWSLEFLESVQLSPGQSTTSTLRVSVPADQSPMDATLHLVVTAAQDSTPTITEGTRVELDLNVAVKHRREGNIAMEVYDTTEDVAAGACAEFSVDVMKRYTAGDIVLSIVDGPESMPTTVLESMWRRENWTYEVDLSGAPGLAGEALETPRPWGLNERHPIGITLCAPFHAIAGAEGILTLRAALAADTNVHDEVNFRVTVLPTRSVEIQVSEPVGRIEASPGDRIQVTLSIANDGNVIEVVDLSLEDLGWMLQVAEDAPTSIDPLTIEEVSVFVTLPIDAAAGSKDLNITFEGDGEVIGNGTMPFSVERRVDLSLEIEGVNLAPLQRGLDARFDMIVRNVGNAPDSPTLSLHARGENGSISESPYLGDLSDLTFTWVAEGVGENGSTKVLEMDDHRHAILGELPVGASIPVTLLIASPSTSPAPELGQHQIGAKVHSIHGGSGEGGDIDESPSWFGTDYDSNEAILIIEFESPDLRIGGVQTEANPSGDTTVIITVENHGNAAVTNVVLQLCADDDAAKVLTTGCTGFSLKAVIPVIDSASAGDVATRDLSIQLNPEDGLEWIIVLDPDGSLGDLSREGDTAIVSIDPVANEEGAFESILGGESGIMRNAMVVLWITIGLLVGLTLVRRLRRRAAGRNDPWTGETSMWSGEAASRDEIRERRDIAISIDAPVFQEDGGYSAGHRSQIGMEPMGGGQKSRAADPRFGLEALASDFSSVDQNELASMRGLDHSQISASSPTTTPPTLDLDLSALESKIEDKKSNEPSIDDLLDGLI